MEIKEFCCNIDYKAPIVIYGTTVGGKIIYQCLKRRGITVDFFCDRSNRYKEFCGIPVNTTDVIEEFHYTILISVTRSFQSVIRYLEKIGYNTVYVCNELLLEEDAKDFEVDANEKSLAEDFFKIYPIYTSYDLSSNGILLPALEVFITEKCTLRCRDCSHLIPRYENPKDYNIDEIKEAKNMAIKIPKVSKQSKSRKRKTTLIAKAIKRILIIGSPNDSIRRRKKPFFFISVKLFVPYFFL